MYLLGDQINYAAEFWTIIVNSWAQQRRGKAALRGGLHMKTKNHQNLYNREYFSVLN